MLDLVVYICTNSLQVIWRLEIHTSDSGCYNLTIDVTFLIRRGLLIERKINCFYYFRLRFGFKTEDPSTRSWWRQAKAMVLEEPLVWDSLYPEALLRMTAVTGLQSEWEVTRLRPRLASILLQSETSLQLPLIIHPIFLHPGLDPTITRPPPPPPMARCRPTPTWPTPRLCPCPSGQTPTYLPTCNRTLSLRLWCPWPPHHRCPWATQTTRGIRVMLTWTSTRVCSHKPPSLGQCSEEAWNSFHGM